MEMGQREAGWASAPRSTGERVRTQARRRVAATLALAVVCLIPLWRAEAWVALGVVILGGAALLVGRHLITARETEAYTRRPACCLWEGSPTLSCEGWENSRWLAAAAPASRWRLALLTNGQGVVSGRMRIWEQWIEWEPGGLARAAGASGFVLPRGAISAIEHVELSGRLGAVVCSLADGSSLDILHRDAAEIAAALQVRVRAG